MTQKICNFIYLIVFSFACNFLMAQGVKRYITIELVTNSRCPICASRVPLMHQQIAPYLDHIDQVTFFASFPYSNCEYYQQNTPLNNARVSYYSPPGTPSAYVWGVQVNMGSGIIPSQYIEDRLDELSLLGIEIEPAGVGFADLTINNLGLSTSGNYTLYAWLVETEVTGGPLQNYQNHYNVARDHLSGLNGMQIELPEAGSSQTWNLEIPEVSPLGNGEFKIIAYVQADDNTILNSTSMLVESSTAIKKSISADLNISPNPCTDHIRLSAIENEEYIIQIINLEGITVSEKIMTGTDNMIIDTTNLLPGVYLLKLTGKANHYLSKFVKS